MSRSSSSAGSKRKHSITISDDEDMQPSRTPSRSRSTLSDGSESGEDDDMVVELSPAEVQQLKSHLRLKKQGFRVLKSYVTLSGVIVEPNKCYELHSDDDSEYGPFVLVKNISQRSFGRDNVVVEGILLRRHLQILPGRSRTHGGNLHAILPLTKNELCMELRTTVGRIGSSRTPEFLVNVCPNRIIGARRVVFTNLQKTEDNVYPFSYQTEGLSVDVNDEISRRFVEEHGVLCCRWKFTKEVDITHGTVLAYQLAPLDTDECDKNKADDRILARQKYGNQTGRARNVVVPSPASPHQRIPRNHRSSATASRTTGRYLFGDACAGGGGTCRGAEQAGLQLYWALDSWNIAIQTLRKNFLQIDDDHFLHERLENLHNVAESLPNLIVDVMHVSFPCQGHSYANRGTNPDRDDMNNALITSLDKLLKLCRPRMFTMEQTNGILTKNEGLYFRMTIQQLTAAGYGARWKVCDMRMHSVPSTRKRLMILGFCPGERMPEWPQPTGGVTVGEAIRDLLFHPVYHNIEEQKARYRRHQYVLPHIDLNRPLEHTIMTNGVQALLRDASELYKPTPRQSMRLMTMPDDHVLFFQNEKDWTTQVGNAVPCLFMKQLFLQVVRALEKSDEEAATRGVDILTID